jgi:hypothetical protein
MRSSSEQSHTSPYARPAILESHTLEALRSDAVLSFSSSSVPSDRRLKVEVETLHDSLAQLRETRTEEPHAPEA